MSELQKITDKLKALTQLNKINEALGSAEYEHAVYVGIEAMQELKRDFDFTTRDFGDSFEPEVNEEIILKFLSKVENFLTYLKDYDILNAIDSQETINKYFEDLIEIIRK